MQTNKRGVSKLRAGYLQLPPQNTERSYHAVTFTFEIPGRLPGMNDLIAAERSNRFVGGQLKKKSTMECAQWILVQRVPKFTKPVSIHFKWVEPNNRRDLDNITAGMKYIFDALVVTGRLKDDRREWVKGISHEFPEPDKEKPRIIVTIKSAEVPNA